MKADNKNTEMYTITSLFPFISKVNSFFSWNGDLWFPLLFSQPVYFLLMSYFPTHSSKLRRIFYIFSFASESECASLQLSKFFLKHTSGAKDVSDITLTTVFRRAEKIARNDYELRHVYPSVCPHGRTWLPIKGSLWKLVSEYILKVRL